MSPWQICLIGVVAWSLTVPGLAGPNPDQTAPAATGKATAAPVATGTVTTAPVTAAPAAGSAASVAPAAVPAEVPRRVGDSQPLAGSAAAAICYRAGYCCKPLPCPTCPPVCNCVVPYCRKPLPCATCLPTGGCCVPYCPKPLPNLCCPPLQGPCD
ncbi:MAG: hypothetical protein ABSF26_30910 [Thermoguttaceae bacterium]|jgi:hypothetical protein